MTLSLYRDVDPFFFPKEVPTDLWVAETRDGAVTLGIKHYTCPGTTSHDQR